MPIASVGSGKKCLRGRSQLGRWCTDGAVRRLKFPAHSRSTLSGHPQSHFWFIPVHMKTEIFSGLVSLNTNTNTHVSWSLCANKWNYNTIYKNVLFLVLLLLLRHKKVPFFIVLTCVMVLTHDIVLTHVLFLCMCLPLWFKLVLCHLCVGHLAWVLKAQRKSRPKRPPAISFDF